MHRVMVSLLTISAACGSAPAPERGPERPRAAAGRTPSPGAADPGEDAEVAPEHAEEMGYPARVVLEPEGGRSVEVRVQLALTDPQRSRGLMHRRHLPEDAGMLFVFDRMEHQSFWMENTYIPLDIVFIDDQLRVVGVVHGAEPLTRDAREVEGASQYVLEVNAGFASRHDIRAGTPVRFENVPMDEAQDDREDDEEMDE